MKNTILALALGVACAGTGVAAEPVEEPFCLPVPENDALAPARERAKALAERENRPFVPYQRLFSGELAHLNPDPRTWCAADGVTPTMAAKVEMAAFRLRAVDAFERGAGQWWNNTAVFEKGMKVGDEVLNVPRIPSVVCATNGDLVAVCDMRCSDSEDLMHGGRITTVFSRSSDGGKTWSSPKVVRDWPWKPGAERWSASDPSLLVDRDTGTIFCFVNAMEHEKGAERFRDNILYRHYVGESRDNGLTWGSFRDITAAAAGLPEVVAATNRQQLFITSGSGLQLKDGSLVVNCNWVDRHKAVMVRSADHGRTWAPFGTPAWPSDENKLVELDDGRLMINARAFAGYGREISVSSDRGRTWTWHTDVSLVDPRCNAEVVRCTAADGTPVLAYAGCGQRRRSTLVLRVSRDEGKTWSERILDPAKCGYVDIAVMPDGSLGILYESDVFERIRFVRVRPDEFFGKPPAASSNITVKIETVAGAPRISVDGRVRSGVCAVPRTPDTTEKIQLGLRDFADMGVEFYSVVIFSTGKNNDWWLGEGKYDFAALDRRIGDVLGVHPSGYVFPRIKCNPPEWWAKANPGEMRAGIENPASLKWRALATRMLGDVVRHIESSGYAHRVIGYHIASMGSSEWEIWPWPKEEEAAQAGDLRDPLPPVADFAARRDYVVRRNAAVADSLLALAKATKEACGGRKLVGAFFGYLISQDHREFSRVCASGLVDFFCAPGNYYDRRPGQPASFQNAYLASMRLHNRLYWDEADVRTWLAPFRYENAILCDYYCHSRYETVNVLKRNSGFALTGGVENWWFLLAGNETFHDEIALGPIRQAFVEEKATLRQEPKMKARVAVFASAEEYLTSCYPPSQVLAEDVKGGFVQTTLRKVGVPFDCYELADVEAANLPDYDVYVFPNAYTLSAARRAAVERLVRRKGKTAIWVFAPGYYRDGNGSSANVTDLTGIEVKETYPVPSGPLSRTLEAADPAHAAKTFEGGWRSVYFPMCPKLGELRKALAEAGVHVWSRGEDIVAVGRDYLMIHASSEGLKRLPLDGAYDVREIFAASPDLKQTREIVEYLRLGETRIYHLE